MKGVSLWAFKAFEFARGPVTGEGSTLLCGLCQTSYRCQLIPSCNWAPSPPSAAARPLGHLLCLQAPLATPTPPPCAARVSTRRNSHKSSDIFPTAHASLAIRQTAPHSLWSLVHQTARMAAARQPSCWSLLLLPLLLVVVLLLCRPRMKANQGCLGPMHRHR